MEPDSSQPASQPANQPGATPTFRLCVGAVQITDGIMERLSSARGFVPTAYVVLPQSVMERLSSARGYCPNGALPGKSLVRVERSV